MSWLQDPIVFAAITCAAMVLLACAVRMVEGGTR